mmetsp:Transcript_526/g.826  ORF Transcript_526/g.826 Transcript_526/m.826 type:complete len:771 (-) Transcript_526:47-2359(-)
MANSGSVFAKQFAGRIKQVGRDGDVVQTPSVPKAIGSGANAKAQISAPPAARQKAASVGVPVAKAKAKAVQNKDAPAVVNDEEEGDDNGGGIMTCANRGLLQQMLMNANKGDEQRDDIASRSEDENDGALSMSMRLVPGTPKAGTQRRAANVPTITSPSSSRVLQTGVGQQRAVSSASVPTLLPKSSSSASAPSLQPKAKIVTATGPPAKTGMPAPVPKIVTGAPRPQIFAPAPPRPGSRGGLNGGNPPAQTIISPANRIGSSGRGSVSTPTASYVGIHATRTKASPAVRVSSPQTKAAMTAGRPLCGPSAFDMLRKMEDSQTLNCEEEEYRGSEGNGSEGEAPGFIMPDGSDASSLDGDHRVRLAELDNVDSQSGASRPVPEGHSRDSHSKSSNDVNKNQSDVIQSGESAADYVERVKRNMGVAAPFTNAGDNSKLVVEAVAPNQKSAAPHPSNIGGNERSREQAIPKPAARARSSDSRSVPSKGPQPSSAVRSQSSDTRTVSAVRQEDAQSANPAEEDSDDDLPASNNLQWKFDLKSMVKDFAREERARQVGHVPAKASGKPQPNRPPKAPPHGHTEKEKQPSHGNVEKQLASAQEPIPPGEQLFFSKKPREVEYTPATMDEYKQKGYGKKEYTELKPTLGPDLDDEDLLHKKAIQQRNKEFSKELQKINKQRMEAAARQGPKAEPKQEPKPTARAKAQEYVRNVPKPKAPQPKPPPERKPKDANSNALESKSEDLADWEEIRRREKQHFADVQRVKDIKSFLGQLNC